VHAEGRQVLGQAGGGASDLQHLDLQLTLGVCTWRGRFPFRDPRRLRPPLGPGSSQERCHLLFDGPPLHQPDAQPADLGQPTSIAQALGQELLNGRLQGGALGAILVVTA